MHLGNPIGTAISVYLTLVAGFAAIAATNAIEEDDRPNLPARVGRSVTLTSLFLGAPAVIILLLVLSSGSKGGNSGIMSKEMGLCFLGVIGLGGVFVAWLGSYVLGMLGGVVAKNLPALGAGAVVFLFTSGGAPLMLLFLLLDLAVNKGRRTH
jgi:hypothetical protein